MSFCVKYMFSYIIFYAFFIFESIFILLQFDFLVIIEYN